MRGPRPAAVAAPGGTLVLATLTVGGAGRERGALPAVRRAVTGPAAATLAAGAPVAAALAAAPALTA
ncbi:MAG: hypothetical protein JWO67_3852, partial [Streptosporangiaceae bacterium]|nr:hypothetical protein [Streptosporangiaceae bacterium]